MNAHEDAEPVGIAITDGQRFVFNFSASNDRKLRTECLVGWFVYRQQDGTPVESLQINVQGCKSDADPICMLADPFAAGGSWEEVYQRPDAINWTEIWGECAKRHSELPKQASPTLLVSDGLHDSTWQRLRHLTEEELSKTSGDIYDELHSTQFATKGEMLFESLQHYRASYLPPPSWLVDELIECWTLYKKGYPSVYFINDDGERAFDKKADDAIKSRRTFDEILGFIKGNVTKIEIDSGEDYRPHITAQQKIKDLAPRAYEILKRKVLTEGRKFDQDGSLWDDVGKPLGISGGLAHKYYDYCCETLGYPRIKSPSKPRRPK